LRLVLDQASLAEAATLVGQLPRELLITTGLVEVMGPAIIVGVMAGIVLALCPVPSQPDGSHWPQLDYRLAGVVPTWLVLPGLGAVLTLPAVVLLLHEDRQDVIEIATTLVFIALSSAVVCLTWVPLRAVTYGHPSGELEDRWRRGVMGGLLWIVIAVPGAISLASYIGLEGA